LPRNRLVTRRKAVAAKFVDVNDQRVGAAFRAIRIKRRWRQRDVADRAEVSASLVSLIERGYVGSVTVDTLRRVGGALDIRVEVLARWRGGELDGLLSARHSTLQQAVAGWLGALPGWTVVPEVSFAIYGERGRIDLLGWHAPTRTLLVIEIKTEIVDIQDLLGVLDQKTRLAAKIARERGWFPRVVATWLVVADGTTNRRRVGRYAGMMRAALPAGTRAMRSWLRAPVGGIAGVSFLPYDNRGGVRARHVGGQRVRLSGRSGVRAATGP